LVSAGETSGDRILARTVVAMKKQYKLQGIEVEFLGLCGPESKLAGVKQLIEMKTISVMGITEVFKFLPKIVQSLLLLKKHIPQVDKLILVDYKDFNFKLANMAYKHSKPVEFIVAPQVWAWRSSRLPKIKKLIKRLFVTLPFEQELFRDNGIDAHFLGHPIRDLLPVKNKLAAIESLQLNPKNLNIAILPGSRESEIKKILPILINSWQLLLQRSINNSINGKKFTGVLSLAKGWDLERIKSLLNKSTLSKFEDLIKSKQWVVSDNSYSSMMACDFGWITSGTATLEAAYYGLPHVLVYKLNKLSEVVFKMVSNYTKREKNYIGLPNIILNEKVIPELLQSYLQPTHVVTETLDILSNTPRLWWIDKQLRWIPKKLGSPGVGERIGQMICQD